MITVAARPESIAACSTLRCPRWTPSNMPIATARGWRSTWLGAWAIFISAAVRRSSRVTLCHSSHGQQRSRDGLLDADEGVGHRDDHVRGRPRRPRTARSRCGGARGSGRRARRRPSGRTCRSRRACRSRRCRRRTRSSADLVDPHRAHGHLDLDAPGGAAGRRARRRSSPPRRPGSAARRRPAAPRPTRASVVRRRAARAPRGARPRCRRWCCGPSGRSSVRYRLSSFMKRSCSEVARPESRIRSPVANGSSVPACPVFAPVRRRTSASAAKDDGPAGLSTRITPVGSSAFGMPIPCLA